MDIRKPPKTIMVGPDINGPGGISHIVKVLRDSGVFERHGIAYVPSVSDDSTNKMFYLIKNYMTFLSMPLSGRPLIYIHTSSDNSFFRKSLFLAAAILLRLKAVMHIHPTHFVMFLSRLQGMKKKYVFFLLSRVHAFVVLTEEMRNNMTLLFPHVQAFLLRNPVDVHALANINNIKRLPDRLLFLGWYLREKGVYDLVDASALLKQRGTRFHLDFFGTKQVDILKAYVEDKKLSDVISINGWIGDEDKRDVLYRSTMLILPSYSEGIPSVILEAMATRTPVVATFVGGLREVLQDHENCIIADVNDAQDLAEKIMHCLIDAPLREKITEQAYSEVKVKYDIKIIQETFSYIMERVQL